MCWFVLICRWKGGGDTGQHPPAELLYIYAVCGWSHQQKICLQGQCMVSVLSESVILSIVHFSTWAQQSHFETTFTITRSGFVFMICTNLMKMLDLPVYPYPVENVLCFSLVHAPPLHKSHGNLWRSFWVILLTDIQANGNENMTY